MFGSFLVFYSAPPPLHRTPNHAVVAKECHASINNEMPTLKSQEHTTFIHNNTPGVRIMS